MTNHDGSLASLVPVADRFISSRGYRLFARVYGDVERARSPALLALHGGPGGSHGYLEPLAALAGPDQPVVLYDQLGCGQSDRPDDPALYTLEAYAEEVRSVRRALGLDRAFVLGHSWGGILALEHALRDPAGIAGLILSNTTSSLPFHQQEVTRLVRALPAEARDVLLDESGEGTPEWQAAGGLFLERHFLGQPWLEEFAKGFDQLNRSVYALMWGSGETRVTGTLRSWDRSRDLSRVRAPTLVIGAERDYFTPEEAARLARGIPKATLEILKDARHMAIVETPETYTQVVRSFLDKHGR